MTSGTLQISSLMSLSCLIWPLTDSWMRPCAGWPISAAGTSGLITALFSKSLPKSHGRPICLAVFCRSRRVMSRPQA